MQKNSLVVLITPKIREAMKEVDEEVTKRCDKVTSEGKESPLLKLLQLP